MQSTWCTWQAIGFELVKPHLGVLGAPTSCAKKTHPMVKWLHVVVCATFVSCLAACPAIIVKYPRVGSTYLAGLLEHVPSISLLWEPTLAQASRHLSVRDDLCRVVSIGDWVTLQSRHEEIESILNRTKSVLIVQVRANSLARGFSAEKLFGTVSPQTVISASRNAILTMEMYVNEANRHAGSLVVWHEDLVRHCPFTLQQIFWHLSLRQPVPGPKCLHYTPAVIPPLISSSLPPDLRQFLNFTNVNTTTWRHAIPFRALSFGQWK
jgi:hypothetical protein